jgi:hypothetical protein
MSAPGAQITVMAVLLLVIGITPLGKGIAGLTS